MSTQGTAAATAATTGIRPEADATQASNDNASAQSAAAATSATSPTPFLEFVKRVLPKIEDALRECIPTPLETSQSADLERYLYEPLRRMVFAGGKRIRPALCLLGATAAGAIEDCALPAACAVELFQAAALIHDDIADKSELRRGMPCIHITDGTGIAINAGDVAIVHVLSQVLFEGEFSPLARVELARMLYDMQRYTLEGQALDLGWVRDGRWDLTEQDYLNMATLKTAYYSAASPLAFGVRCADGNPLLAKALHDFGLAAGLAFQIQDDILNLVGDATAQGKDFRSDVTEGKRTLVMVRALQHLEPSDANELRAILSAHTTEKDALARAVELATEAGAVDYARAYAQGLVQDAEAQLDIAQISSEARSVLVSMANYFVSREA